MVRICVDLSGCASGKIWQGVGVESDIEVSRKITDIYTGHDTVLQKGIEVLKELMKEKNGETIKRIESYLFYFHTL